MECYGRFNEFFVLNKIKHSLWAEREVKENNKFIGVKRCLVFFIGYNHQSPITNHQSPITNHQEAVSPTAISHLSERPALSSKTYFAG